MRQSIFPAILIVGIVTSGCSGMSSTEQRTLSGGAIGAAGGALVGAIAGNAGLGAAVGGGAGLLGGYVYDLQRRANRQP